MLITAGPTHEPIDAVRYIGNRSSGRMGLALAEAALRRGRTVTLLLGPASLAPPEHSRLTVIRFRTAADLERLLAEHWPRHDVLLMAAAVADYRPAETGRRAKRPRGDGPWTLRLDPTPDLLAGLARITRPGQLAIGFALEPADRLRESARRKLRSKNLDGVVANPLEAMDSETVRATLLLRDGRELSPPRCECSKREFAHWLLEQIESLS